jgi:hypothetical protein
LAYEANKLKTLHADLRRTKKQLELARKALALSTMRARRGHAEELHAVLAKLEEPVAA